MSEVYILIGGNLSDRERALTFAISEISKNIGKITLTSSIFESEPWGFSSPDLFLNQVVKVQTILTPKATLKKLQEIERLYGRARHSGNYESRTIDLDILFFDDLMIHERDLHIPHPRLHMRKFTLSPLVEIAGDYVHPFIRKSMNDLAAECTDRSQVRLFKKDMAKSNVHNEL
ncbi:MAG: 2-amino-4-hydroxy-6-hydroxymethyldihydropteridine diphosphokinase [Bacteroidales bacterium]